MKKILILSLVTTCFFVPGCSKVQQNDNIKKEDSSTFTKDTLVIQLLNMNSQLMNKMYSSIDTIKPLFRKKIISSSEKMKISKTLGFENINEFDLFLKTQFELIKKIKDKYPNITKSSCLNDLLYNAIQKNQRSNIKKSLMLDDRCSERLNNCLALGNSVYTAEILGCTAGAIGVGSVTLGIGGILFQLACGAVALEHLSIMRTGCQLDYNDCR